MLERNRKPAQEKLIEGLKNFKEVTNVEELMENFTDWPETKKQLPM